MSDDSVPLNFGVSGRTVELAAGTRIITRQQLRNAEFYKVVKAGLLDGSVTALDQGNDSLTIGKETLPLTDAKALQALADSQQEWVGVPEKNPYAATLIKESR